MAVQHERSRSNDQAGAQPHGENGDQSHDDKEPPKKPWSPRTRWMVGLSIGSVVLVGIIFAVVWWLHARQYESTDDAFIDAHVEKLAPQVAGRMLRVLVDDNDHVEAGQPVAEIDPADFKAQLAQAEAQKASANASVQQAEADVERARVNRDNSVTELHRYEGLSAEAQNKQRLDDLRAAVRTAESQLQAAGGQLESAKASVQSAQAQVDLAKLRLSWTTIKAVTGGRVTNRSVQAGDYVAVGQQLMVLVPDQVWVTANFKETQLTRMQPGQRADIEVDAFPDEELHGTIQSIQRGSGAWFSLLPPENATGNYVKVVQRVPVKILIDDTHSPAYGQLGPGMSVTPKVKVR